MTTTKELRHALQSVEPAVPSIDVAALRRRARRIRLQRRLAGGVGGLAVVATGVAVLPTLAPHLPNRGAAEVTMPAPDRGGADEVAEAMSQKRLTPRTGALRVVRSTGERAAISVIHYDVWIEPSSAKAVVGEFCWQHKEEPQNCSPLNRDFRGLVNMVAIQTDERKGVTLIGVAEAPIARAVAASSGRQASTQLSDLGQGYVAMVAFMPTQPADFAKINEHLWGFDDRGRLVAHYAMTPSSNRVPRTVAEARKQTELVVRSEPLPASSAEGPHIRLAGGVEVYMAKARPPTVTIDAGVESVGMVAGMSEHGWLFAVQPFEPTTSRDEVRSYWFGLLRKPVASVVVADRDGQQLPVVVKDLGQGFVLAAVAGPKGTAIGGAWAFDDGGRLIAEPDGAVIAEPDGPG